MRTIGHALVTGCLLFASAAWAAPGKMHEREASGPADDETIPERAVGINEEPLRILDASRASACSTRAGVCFQAGARTTILVESQPVVTAKSTTATPPRFQRAAAVAAAANEAPHAETSRAWTLDVAAQLKRAAVAGNTLFLFYDLEDPDAVRNQQPGALFQAPVKGGKQLAAHLSLSPEDGFRAGHTYRLRIAQLLNGREALLAESDFSLL